MAFDLFSGLLSGIGAGVGGYFQGQAAKDAADVQAQSAANALAFQRKVYGDTQHNFEPYLGIGKGAINQLGGMYGIGPNAHTPGQSDFSQFTASPDYQFALQQGQQALDRQGAASGGFLSGGQLKAGQQFGQGLASQQFGNYFNRLMSLATIGQNSAANAATSGGTQANNIASTQLAGGAYQAGGILGQANAYAQAPQNALAMYQMLTNPGGSGYQNVSVGNPQSGGSSPYRVT